MRRFCVSLLMLVLAWHSAALGWAKDYKLTDGSTYSGEISDGNDYGVVFRLKTGGFTSRVPWSKFSQEALKLLAENEKVKPYVEPFIEVEQVAKPKPKTIVVRDPARVDRPLGRTTFFSSFTTPLGLAVLGLLYLANLYGAYEIGQYRNRPVAVVCGLSAVLPLLGPLIFLVSPTLEGGGGASAAPEAEAGGATPAVATPGSPGGSTSRRIGSGVAGVAPPVATGLRVAAAHDKGGGGKFEAKIFKRGDYTFNRRFVETQFSGFFRVVPTESEKDLVLVINTPKNEYVGKRISRISSNEFFLQLLQGGGKEVSITFGEIVQIAVRHVDEIKE